jgi:hypothetical protein
MPGGILGLDPSTAAFGWSYFEPGIKQPEWGHLRLGAKGAEPGAVGAALCLFLEARIAVFKPCGIAIESVYVPTPRKPRFVKGGSPFVFGAELVAQADDHHIPINPKVLARLYGLNMLVLTVAHQHGIPCSEVTTGDFCTYFLGKRPPRGRPAKKAANVEMCRLLGWTPVTQDEADALALGAYAEARLFPEMRLAMKRPAGPLFAKPLDTGVDSARS